MKVLVSKRTGMVALVAGPNITNRAEGSVFGAAPKDAARLLGREHASVVPKDELPKGDYDEVTIDLEAAQVVEPMKSKARSGDDDAHALLRARVAELEKSAADQAKSAAEKAKADATKIADLEKRNADLNTALEKAKSAPPKQ